MESRSHIAITCQALGWQENRAQLENVLRLAETQLRFFAQAAKGYLGWLMLNPVFLEEQNELLQKWHREIEKLGLPQLALATTGKPPKKITRKMPPRFPAFFEQFEQFYLRWRLLGLATPNLPIPLTPQTPLPAPILAMGPMNRVGSLFFVPDTYPIPSRDQLRNLLEDSLRHRREEEHLSEWSKIVSGKNSAKNRIERYARLFEMQHYVRILTERHSELMEGHVHELEAALAKFLDCRPPTIHRDLSFIRKCQALCGRSGAARRSAANDAAGHRGCANKPH
jgi:hypothetical protein